MDNYLNKKVEIKEKIFSALSSTNMPANAPRGWNLLTGVITNIIHIAGKSFLELDNKILVSLDYIYKIEIID